MGYEIVANESVKKSPKEKVALTLANKEVAQGAKKYHQSFPMYQPTPLRNLENLSKQLGVKGIYVKDEAYRFGLNAFKVLGGSYAIGEYIAKKLSLPMEEMTYDKLIATETREKVGKQTFISATDGNHGRGVAWTAHQLLQDCVIYMPKGSSKERLENIRKEGAKAEITDFNYDDSVRLASKEADEKGWVLVQDTSWLGYEDIPKAIIKGYTTMALEAYEQLQGVKPTHIFVQAGVGSFATAMTAFFSDIYKEEKPIMTVVEPNEAACVFKTMKANDGCIHPVTGEMQTIMAGLACGEPVTVGIDILRDYADYFVSCPDEMAADGMRVLGAPLGGDERITAGESGAAGFGFGYAILTHPELEEMRKMLQITKDSVLLFFNTEGDTDQENYRKIVWEGKYARR